MMKKRNILLIGITIILIAILIILYGFSSKGEGFSTNTIFLKLNIPSGGEFVKDIKITNQENREQNFNLYFNDLEDFATIGDEEFTLEAGESRDIRIYFKDLKEEIGVYPGKLTIKTRTLKKEIPIILNIEDENSIFLISQTSIPKYSNVYPGGKFGIEIKIFNLQAHTLRNIEVEYFVKNLDDDLLIEDSEDLIIGESFGTTKIIDIPKDIPYGDYVFITSVEYGGTKSATGHLFKISKKELGAFSGDLKFFVIAILIFVIGIMVLFIYFIKTRDQLLLQLKRQQSSELKRDLKAIENYKEKIGKLKDLKERKRKIKALKRVRKRITKTTKAKQKRQTKELKILRKKGKKSDVRRTMQEWRRSGYKMPEVEKEVRKVSKSGIKKQVKDWKEKGYDLGS